jgi:thiamine biosynthesis lipoprotein
MAGREKQDSNNKDEGTPGALRAPTDTTVWSRRRFLVGLGVAAAAGALGRALFTPQVGRRVRLEASRPMLGTWVRLVAVHEDSRGAEIAIAKGFGAIAAVDAQMSIHRSDSELARVNAAAGEAAVQVSPAVLEVVSRAKRAALASARVYDPTVLPLMRLYGFYDSGRTHLPSDREITATLDAMGPQHIVMDPAAGTLGLGRTGTALDLGSIGKGWAVDRAVEAMRAAGVIAGLVDVGRNVYGIGAPDEEPRGWAVGVVDPRDQGIDRVFHLKDSAIATSGNHEQWRELDGIRVGHLMDAHLGHPALTHVSATCHARSGVASDEGSTLAYLLGPGGLAPLGGDLLESHFIG